MEQKNLIGKMFTSKDLINYAPDSVVSKIILEKPNGNVTMFALDEGQFISEHKTPFDAMVQVIDGEAEITIDKKQFNLVEGQLIIMPSDIPHALKANKKFKMMLTMIK
jgi:quercetin dioxygenase-like cupin family protein